MSKGPRGWRAGQGRPHGEAGGAALSRPTGCRLQGWKNEVATISKVKAIMITTVIQETRL